jgi:hypothetical protein
MGLLGSGHPEIENGPRAGRSFDLNCVELGHVAHPGAGATTKEGVSGLKFTGKARP